MSTNVVELVVRLQDKLTTPLQDINGKLATFGSRISGLVGAAGILGAASALLGFAKSSFEAADALGDAADRAGVTSETLSRLKFLAEQNDVDFSSLTIAIKRWQVTLSQAASGSKDAAASLKLLQLSAADLKGLSLEEQLAKIAGQFARIKDPADQTRVAVELFGRSGEQLVPLLNKGSGAVAELTAKADELGITLDSRTTKSVDAADKALKRLFATISAGGQRAAGSLALAIVGPQGELDAAELKLEQLKKQRDELANPGALTKLFVPSGPRENAVANLNRQIDQQLRAVNALKRAAKDAEGSPLDIAPEPGPITEVTIKQQKAQLEGLAKLLDDFEQSTRTSEEKIYQDYRDTVTKIQELTGKISPDEQLKRLNDARIKYEEAVTIDPVKITQSKVIIEQTLTANQRSVNKFVDTLQTGLDNLAQSGNITGRSILKYLLSAFEAQALKDAIDGLGRYLKKSLGDALDGSGGSSGGLGSLLNGLFSAFGSTNLSGKSGVGNLTGSTRGYAAGGGSMSGPRIVGEDGPELDWGGGNIMNRRQLQFAMGGGGSPTINAGDNIVNIQGNADSSVIPLVQAAMAANNKKQLDTISTLLKNNYGRPLR